MGVCGRDTSVAAIATLLAGKLKPNAILTLAMAMAMTIANINDTDIDNMVKATGTPCKSLAEQLKPSNTLPFVGAGVVWTLEVARLRLERVQEGAHFLTSPKI